MLLADLPKEHPLRNTPLGGFYSRYRCWQGGYLQSDKPQYRGVTPWKRQPKSGEGYNDPVCTTWTYNELKEAGGFWTTDVDWTAEPELHPKPPRPCINE